MRRLVQSLSMLAGVSCAGPNVAPPVAPVAVVATKPAPVHVDYTLSPVLEQGVLVALAVEIRLQADASGVTRMMLPDHWADARDLHRYVRDWTVEGASKVLAPSPVVRDIHAAAGTPLVVRYRVVSAYDRVPTADDGQPFAPIVRPEFFYVFGEALFAAPADMDLPARFTWTGAPAGFGFASDLEHFAGGRPGIVGDVIESIVVGGPQLKVETRMDGGGAVRTAIAGEFGFGDAAFVDLALAVIATERAFWDDHGAPFLIVLAPLKSVPGSMSLGGTGRSDAFALTVVQDAPLAELRHLLGHEYFHTWNPRALGHIADETAEMTGKWFAEGFTEFYTWRLLLRGGLFTLEDFVAAWNDALREYASSPALLEPNARIIQDYWNDKAVGRLPYRRGPMLAAMWDQQIRRATRGSVDLDDVLLKMRRGPIMSPAELFVATYEELGGPSLAADLERFVDRGERVSLPADVFGECIRVETSTRPSFERGWDPEATTAAGNVITGIKKESPAYRAGLRDGMKIVEREAGEPGDSTKPYVLRVHDGKRARIIKFLPAGAGTVTLQQLVLSADVAARREVCTRVPAGL